MLKQVARIGEWSTRSAPWPVRTAAAYAGELGLLEDAEVPAGAICETGAAETWRMIIPYAGALRAGADGHSAIADSNAAVIVPHGERLALRPLAPRLASAALIFTPSPWALRLLKMPATQTFSDDGGGRLSIPLATRLSLRRLAACEPRCPGPRRDTSLLMAVGKVFSASKPHSRSPAMVERAIEILNERGCEPIAIDEIAGKVGVCGIYLTQQFTRSEGLPLYRYHLQLRLSRALVDLPRCDDITALALDLGFSSHSHFSASFKAAFGVTPSSFRAEAMRGR